MHCAYSESMFTQCPVVQEQPAEIQFIWALPVTLSSAPPNLVYDSDETGI